MLTELYELLGPLSEGGIVVVEVRRDEVAFWDVRITGDKSWQGSCRFWDRSRVEEDKDG